MNNRLPLVKDMLSAVITKWLDRNFHQAGTKDLLHFEKDHFEQIFVFQFDSDNEISTTFASRRDRSLNIDRDPELEQNSNIVITFTRLRFIQWTRLLENSDYHELDLLRYDKHMNRTSNSSNKRRAVLEKRGWMCYRSAQRLCVWLLLRF